VTDALAATIASLVVDVPDYPSPGVLFKDISPLLADPVAFRSVVDGLVAAAARFGPIDVVAGVEARGFVLAAPMALSMGAAFVPVRKGGKLPRVTIGVSYDLEYGSALLEIHADAVLPGQRVLVVDDVLATGGTAVAAVALVAELGGEVAAVSVLLELGFLGGRARLEPVPVTALLALP
jgi:adenine phosphoribosyltransferase